ncbi:MAG: tRNA uridine-5-carboxymethylaminomethyl(34) synthesis GTPase MnmE [Pyrinomonadaceae bacterium]|jgi:tRNA modification GTPase
MSGTIAALATPSGRSGIGVIRLSGENAREIAERIAPKAGSSLLPRRAKLAEIVDPQTGQTIDTAVITYFQSPHSFTGEDVVEISCHGSPVVLRQVLDLVLRLGARPASAGEFTLRALANGKLDLSEAEAIRDLIEAGTAAAARQAIRQMRGEFSHRLSPIKERLLDVIVILESSLEFVEDDLPTTATEQIKSRLADIEAELRKFAATFDSGRLVRDGIRVALAGRPNVGKSSLFNALIGDERAIVTEIAGTTRDEIRERFVIDDIAVYLTDTAGLRETGDVVEKIGVERSRRAIADSDLCLAVIDATEPVTEEDRAILKSIEAIPSLIVINKIDKSSDFDERISELGDMAASEVIKVSALTGAGLDTLKASIIGRFRPAETDNDGFLVTDARHYDLLIRAAEEIAHANEALSQKMSEEIVLVGLHNALRYLGSITGETTTEDMLTRIFSTFCIGK